MPFYVIEAYIMCVYNNLIYVSVCLCLVCVYACENVKKGRRQRDTEQVMRQETIWPRTLIHKGPQI